MPRDSQQRTLGLLLLLLALPPPARAQQPALPSRPTPTADGAAVDDIVVVTASRREEQLLNAPATMTVIGEDVIATAADQSVPALLRLVPGLNVVQTSARDLNVTTRAATGTLSDSMLVLLDGRSVYQDLFGFVLWDFLPIDSSEMKQIEVIRGPASAVWGANAMNGVVNVISKTPRDMLGTSVGILFGQFDRSPADGPFDGGGSFSLNVAHAQAVSDRFAYKLSGGITAQEALLRPTGNLPGTRTPYPPFSNAGTAQPKLDARVDYDFADRRQKIVFAGGISGTEGIIHTGLGPLDVQRGSTLKYGRRDLHAREVENPGVRQRPRRGGAGGAASTASAGRRSTSPSRPRPTTSSSRTCICGAAATSSPTVPTTVTTTSTCHSRRTRPHGTRAGPTCRTRFPVGSLPVDRRGAG